MRRALVVGICALAVACSKSGPPETLRSPVADTYHGVEVTDDYRWLEDWDDPRVREWSDAQNAYARGILDALPSVPQIRRRVEQILRADSVEYSSLAWRGGMLFAKYLKPPMEQEVLIVMPSADEPDAARVLEDPVALDPAGTTTVDWYEPSPDGTLVAVSLSKGGTESGDLHFFDVETGQQVGDVIPRVNGGTAGGDVAWTNDGAGLFYTRYPRPGERPDEDLDFHQQVWFHRWGTSTGEDRYEIGEDFMRTAEIRLETDPAGRVLATVQEGDSGRFEHHLRDSAGEWRRLTVQEDGIVQAVFGPDGSLFLISRREAPRGKVLVLPPGGTSLDRASTIIEEGREAIVSDFYDPGRIAVTDTRIHLAYQLGGPSTIRTFDHRGRPQRGPNVPPVSSVGQILALDGDAILFSNESYLEPRAYYRFDAEDGIARKMALVSESPVDYSDTLVAREFAASKDGTQVPVSILHREGIDLDGSHALLLTGYGGYGISEVPHFEPSWRVWIEQGGLIAVANLRGGGEFGEEWHRAGMLTSKQNVFDDFAAVMRHLIDRGYTSRERLAIMGASNGGLLMGAMITQQPDLCRAVVSLVGIYDMLRVELSPNGAFNIPEFGTVEDPEQFRPLHAYSPYHNVLEGTSYPAVLFATGANDPRVDPMHSRKMTARLQAASASGRPILLRTSAETGHGLGTPLGEQVEEWTHTYAFLFHELGVRYGG